METTRVITPLTPLSALLSAPLLDRRAFDVYYINNDFYLDNERERFGVPHREPG
jgi:hypothetical protein